MAFELVQIPYQNNWSQYDDLDKFLADYQQSGQNKALFDAQVGYDTPILKSKIMNGLNMGDKNIDSFIKANYIRQPQTEEEIEDARAGQFNQPLQNALRGSVEDAPTKWDSFWNGYRENYDNAFRPSNLAKDNSKGFAYRLGEGLGSVGRFVDSPLGRGLIAAGLNSALGYDNSLQEGVTAFLGRQNAVTADKLYRRQLKDYGYTDEDLSNIRGNITTDMYKNLANNLYRTRQLETRMAIANTKDKSTQAKLILDAYKNNMFTEQEALLELAKNGIDINTLMPSNETRRTDARVMVDEARAEDIKNPKAKVKVSRHHNDGDKPTKTTKPTKKTDTTTPKTGTTKNGTKYRILN